MGSDDDVQADVIGLCIGTAILTIRQYVAEPAQRAAVARAMGRSMVELVNDPSWPSAGDNE